MSHIDLKKAVDSALRAAKEYYEDKDLHNLLLEEVVFSENQECWMITIGFDIPDSYPPSGINTLARTINGPSRLRKFKIFEIDGYTGNVNSMKIREME